MAINLSSYKAIECGLFVRIEITDPSIQILRFSDYHSAVTINSEVYQPLGNLCAISNSTSELRTSGDTVTVSVSGIPNSSLTDIINSRLKGSNIIIYRVFFNPTTGTQLAITGNPAGRFYGIVNNYSLQEEHDVETRTSNNMIVMTCSSLVEVLNNKFTGRRTNPIDQKNFYATDVSFDRVPNLSGSYIDFGAPQ